MTTKNDITGDKIQTKGVLSEQGRANWDAIFRKDNKGEQRPDADASLRVSSDDKESAADPSPSQ